MIVYGDPQFETTMSQYRSRLLGLCDAGVATLDKVRELLIACGQLEQAVEDYTTATDEQKSAAKRVTDTAAQAFLRKLNFSDAPMHGCRDAISAIPGTDDLLSIKIPEGYAFYALYPEQYVASAQDWLNRHHDTSLNKVLVVGIRSIGTSLSALVCAVFAIQGWAAERITVRPTGHPFERVADLGSISAQPEWLTLVVDEGPGLSGSSMAAVHDALTRRGVPSRNISFFPGHSGMPGAQATPRVNSIWENTTRYFTPLANLKWSGRSLEDVLKARAADIAGVDPAEISIEDAGGGLWRRFAYQGESEWPEVCAGFERTKYLCSLPDGSKILWKFAGLANAGEEHGGQLEAALARMTSLAELGWIAAPLSAIRGFIAMPWIAGERLTRESANAPEMIMQIGRYIADSAQQSLAPGESNSAFKRLREILYWNTWEALGEEIAGNTCGLADKARDAAAADLPSYGDGHMSPHEWIRTGDGQLLKVDCTGHDCDHTAVGRQPVWWDIAGAAVEWGLSEAQTEALLRITGKALSCDFTQRGALSFYRAAYAAFRLGQTTLCAGMATEGSERDHLAAATARYRQILLSSLCFDEDRQRSHEPVP